MDNTDRQTDALKKKAKDLKGILQKDVASLEKGAKSAIIVGVVLAIVVGLYFNWIRREVVKALEPEALAVFAHAKVTQTLPTIAADIENKLKELAPELADEAESKILKGIPIVRKQLETQCIRFIDAVAVELNQKIALSVAGLIEEYGEEAKEILPQLTDEMIVEELVKGLRADLLAGADHLMMERTGESIDVKLEQSLVLLNKIGSELKRLQQAEQLSHRELLEKQVVEIIIAITRKMRD